MFAIVKISGKQYKVSKGQIILVNRQDAKAGDSITFDSVLLKSEAGKITIGTPTIKGASVVAKVVAQEMGEKVEVRRFKSKVRTRKETGFRPQLTKLEIVSVG